MVQVHELIRRRDHVVARRRRARRPLRRLPRLHHRAVLEPTSVHYLVPANEALAARRQEAPDAVHHPTLKLFFVLETFAANYRLAGLTRAPAVLGHLVATDVHVRGGEERQYLVEHAGQELERDRRARAEDLRKHSPRARHLDRRARTPERRIRRDRRHAVARQLDLRHHRDAPRRRVRDDLADLRLRVEAAVARSIGLASPGPDAGEFGKARDLDAPALVVREVPMEHVELVARHQIEMALDVRHRQEVPCRIEHRAAPRKARRIHDSLRRDTPRRASHRRRRLERRGQQLAQRLRAPARPLRRARGDGHAGLVHLERVAFGVLRGDALQHDRRRARQRRKVVLHRDVIAGALAQDAGEHLARGGPLRRRVAQHDAHGVREHKRRLRHPHIYARGAREHGGSRRWLRIGDSGGE